MGRGRANMARTRQSGPDSALGFNVNVLQIFYVGSFSLGSGREEIRMAGGENHRSKGVVLRRIFIELMTSDHKLKVSREGSK